MILFSAVLAGVGLTAILWRKTTLGVLVGLQLMIFGAVTFWAIAGHQNGQAGSAHAFGVLLVCAGVFPILLGLSLSVRLFYLKQSHQLSEIRSLKH